MKQSLLALALLSLASVVAHGQGTPAGLSAGQTKKAQKLIAKLEKLDSLIATNPDLKTYKSRLQPLATSIYKAVSSLPESDVKTDIATAVRFYELLARVWDEKETPADTRCAHERPGFYDRLCHASPSRPAWMLAKARLHLLWARTVSNGDAGDISLLHTIAQERENDRTIAQQAIRLLRTLENQVVIHPSLGDFEQTGTLTRVPPEKFQQDLGRISVDVRRILEWLPQNRLTFQLTNALYAFQDGATRWSQVHQSRVVRVSDLAASKTFAPSVTAYELTVPYTVAINWRQANMYLERAEALAR